MSEEQHVALPKLVGAPAYARPPRVVETEDRPPTPDDLPLEVFQTEEERELAAALAAAVDGSDVKQPRPRTADRSGGLRPRPFKLRALGRILGSNS